MRMASGPEKDSPRNTKGRSLGSAARTSTSPPAATETDSRSIVSSTNPLVLELKRLGELFRALLPCHKLQTETCRCVKCASTSSRKCFSSIRNGRRHHLSYVVNPSEPQGL